MGSLILRDLVCQKVYVQAKGFTSLSGALDETLDLTAVIEEVTKFGNRSSRAERRILLRMEKI